MNRDERNLGGDNVRQKRGGQARMAGKSAGGKKVEENIEEK